MPFPNAQECFCITNCPFDFEPDADDPQIMLQGFNFFSSKLTNCTGSKS
jgi:hypothetical protein